MYIGQRSPGWHKFEYYNSFGGMVGRLEGRYNRSPHWSDIVVATESPSVGKQAVHIPLECFLVSLLLSESKSCSHSLNFITLTLSHFNIF